MNANEIAFGIEFETTLQAPTTHRSDLTTADTKYLGCQPDGKQNAMEVSDPRTPLAKDASL